jgi:hypothetical protein
MQAVELVQQTAQLVLLGLVVVVHQELVTVQLLELREQPTQAVVAAVAVVLE